VDRAELEDFKRALDKAYERLFWGLPVGGAAVGFGVAEGWSTIGGVVVAAVILIVGWETLWCRHSRRGKARWVKRSPEVADPRCWRDSG
jgi:hypothetical protein